MYYYIFYLQILLQYGQRKKPLVLNCCSIKELIDQAKEQFNIDANVSNGNKQRFYVQRYDHVWEENVM